MMDINTVCCLLGTTSRTLRFYEEKQIISSTRLFGSSRRQYTSSQIDQIKNVMVLRSLDFSVNEIRELQKSNSDLRSAIEINKAKLYSLINEKIKTIQLLDEALTLIENGRNVVEITEKDLIECDKEHERIAIICTDAIISDDMDKLYGYFSQKLQTYMPKEVFENVRADMLRPLGAYVCKDRIETDNRSTNLILQYVKFEKLGLIVKYAFYDSLITGLWFNYYEM